ncbi:carboxypeptidase regulatory-like domain-containing protein [Acidicapsa dinghuensis]|uniref:Carboxypeptidase regulatory-like domain-containing protein n=1 Tax=Acidicapsa dinghuensis TaxID=2218256 RepID=A0ABW1ELK4_9BACT|nr:TonB-dependent receptor [Acidicapsa dinghuensis]
MASITGDVVDAQGKPVAGAEITITSTDLSAKRVLRSSDSGGFRVQGLVPGAYEIKAEAKLLGLILKRPLRLTLTLGSNTEVSVRLAPTAVHQSTTVHARAGTSEGNTLAPAINKTEVSQNSFLAGMTVTYLPNRDRDFSQFAQLAAGTHEDSTGSGVIISGQRASSVVTQVDGTNFDNPLTGSRRGAEDGSFFLPQTVVREFEIVRSGVTAQTGNTNAGFINVATKEGSNKFHGEAFYTGRPATLTAADAFDRSLDNQQNTFGGSFGGPIHHDRSFFYAGTEQDFLHAPYYAQFEPQASGVDLPEQLASMQGQITERNTPTAGFARFDFLLNSANTLNLEFSANRVRATNISDGSTRTIGTEDFASSLGGQSFWVRGGLTTVVSSQSVNQFVTAWSSDHRHLSPNSNGPEFYINGFGILGGDALGEHLYSARRFELADTFSVEAGKTSVDIGSVYSYDPMYEQREENLNGRFDYNSLDDFLANNPRRFQQTFAVGNTRFSGSINELALFINAKRDLTKHIVLTAGLRWAGQWNPQSAQKIPNDLMQWQPRLGLAWNPTEKTVVRISAGIYDAATPGAVFHRVISDSGTNTIVADSYFDPELLALTDANTNAPHALATPPTLIQSHALVVNIDPGFRNPSSAQVAFSVDQQFLTKLEINAGYLHSATWRLQRRLDENLNPPTVNADGIPIFPSVRPNSAVGRDLVNQSSAHSSYNAFLLTATSQISRRTQLVANYTLSQTRDDDSSNDPYGIDSAVNPFELQQERAFSSLDERQTLNLEAIFNLPLGFKCNPLFVTHSGQPYNPIIGFDTQNDANDWNDRAVINGVMSARNSMRQPAFSDLDLRVVKDFTLKGEGHHLDLFLDVFNLAGAENRNFGADAISLFGLPSQPVFTAGQPQYAPGVTRIGGPREVQFTARLVAF